MKYRTEEEWRTLHDNALCGILSGRAANMYYDNWSIGSIISDALNVADHLVQELKKKEEKEIQSPPVP